MDELKAELAFILEWIKQSHPKAEISVRAFNICIASDDAPGSILLSVVVGGQYFVSMVKSSSNETSADWSVGSSQYAGGFGSPVSNTTHQKLDLTGTQRNQIFSGWGVGYTNAGVETEFLNISGYSIYVR